MFERASLAEHCSAAREFASAPKTIGREGSRQSRPQLSGALNTAPQRAAKELKERTTPARQLKNLYC